MKKISVIIPAYNAEEYIEGCIVSLLEQTYRELELLVINDGSTDGTGAILASLAEKHGNIKVITLENGGASRARNAGIEAASGDIIAFADADDLLLPDAYEKMMRAMEREGADLVQCGFYVELDGLKLTSYTVGGVLEHPAKGGGRRLWSVAPSCWCKLYRRQLLEGIRFDPDIKVGEDMLFNLRVLTRAKKMVLLEEPLYRYMQREGSICLSAPNADTLISYRNMTELALAELKDFPALRPFIRSLRMLELGGIASKTVRYTVEGGEAVRRQTVKEIRRNLFFILFGSYMPKKERLKLCYIGLMPRAYARRVRKKHGRAVNG